jgi:RHS repeat-associated protein
MPQIWTVYDGANTYADFDGNGNLTNRYLYGLGVDQLFGKMDANGNVGWYLTDLLGSVRLLTSPSGGVLDSVNYDSFGSILSESSPTNGDRFKFTGREFDSTTGLQFNRARYFDGKAGRWTTQDPSGFRAGDANLYRYTANLPTILSDPSGLDLVDKIFPDSVRDWFTNRGHDLTNFINQAAVGVGLAAAAVAPVLMCDESGRIHGKIYDEVPKNWGESELEAQEAELEESIGKQGRLGNQLKHQGKLPSVSHESRLQQEQSFLKKVKDALRRLREPKGPPSGFIMWFILPAAIPMDEIIRRSGGFPGA